MKTHYEILILLIASLEEAIEHGRKLKPDVPIQDQFDDVFTMFTFILGTFFFELESDCGIPE